MTTPSPHPISAARRRWGQALTAVSLVAIAWLTLRPGPGEVGGLAEWTPSDVVLNILLFVPLGIGLVLAGVRPISAFLLGLLCSAGIEAAQRWWVPGRFTSVVDLASNGVGAAAGAAAVAAWGHRRRWWPWVARLSATVVILAWFLGGYVAQPAIPGATHWLSEWAPASPNGMRFRGQVLEVRLQHRALPAGPVAEVGALRAQLMASRKTILEARFVWPSPGADSAAIVQVMVGEGRNRFLTVAQRGSRLVAYQRTGLWWVGLRTPWIELPSGFRPGAGDTVDARLVATRRAIELTATVHGRTTGAWLRLSPELYFSSQWNRATDGVLWWWVIPGMISIFVLGLALARRPRRLVVVGLATILLSVLGGGCDWPSPWMVFGAAVGGWAGVLVGRALGLAGPRAGGEGLEQAPGQPDR